MALHDYGCRHCDTVLTDQYRPVTEGALANPPVCPSCGNRMAWIPQIGRMDAFEPFQEFVAYDGQNRPVTIESFAQMRRLERESEQQFRNGEGQPIRFRALHQSRANMGDNTFGPAPNQRPSPEAARKFGLQGATKPIDATSVPDYGPGVDDSNTSALKD